MKLSFSPGNVLKEVYFEKYFHLILVEIRISGVHMILKRVNEKRGRK